MKVIIKVIMKYFNKGIINKKTNGSLIFECPFKNFKIK